MGGWSYVGVSLQHHSHKAAIREVVAHMSIDWKRKLIAQLSHYRRLAPYFHETRDAIETLIVCINESSITKINAAIMRGLSSMLGVKREILISSEQGFDYSRVRETEDWAVHICEQMGASTYINPIGGAHLYSAETFEASGIQLQFLEPESTEYDRGGGPFLPALSIIDVMMFIGIAGTASLLPDYRILGARAGAL